MSVINFEAMIETVGLAGKIKPYKTVEELCIALDGAHQEEIAARNSYQIIIESFKLSGFDISDIEPKLVEKLKEIIGDEENHAGILHEMRKKLDSGFAKKFSDGEAGKE